MGVADPAGTARAVDPALVTRPDGERGDGVRVRAHDGELRADGGARRRAARHRVRPDGAHAPRQAALVASNAESLVRFAVSVTAGLIRRCPCFGHTPVGLTCFTLASVLCLRGNLALRRNVVLPL